MKRASFTAPQTRSSRQTPDTDPHSVVGAPASASTTADANGSQRQSRRAALRAAADQSQQGPLAWASKRRRTGLPASSFNPIGASSTALSDAAIAFPAPPAESLASQTGSDHLSDLPDEVLMTIVRHFPLGANEPSRLAVTGKAVHRSVKHRALADKLFRLTTAADASDVIEIIDAAQPLPDPLKTYVLRYLTERLTALCPGAPCLATQFDALRSAIASIGQDVCRTAASLTLGERFCDDRFRALPVTPALENFFRAFRDDIDSLPKSEDRQAAISRWASGLHMLRDPAERLQQWQTLIASDIAQPHRTDLVVSLGFALMALPPVAERVGAIDAIIKQSEGFHARAQAVLTAPVLKALGQEPADQVQREDRFFLLWQRALSLPATEKQAALCQLVSRIHLLRTTKRFNSMRFFVAQMDKLGYEQGTNLMCATFGALPQLVGGEERDLTWIACSQALQQMPRDRLDAPLSALIDTLPFLPNEALRAQRFAILASEIITLPLAQQAAPISHLLGVLPSLPAGAARSEAVTKLMLLIQLAPGNDRVTNMRILFGTLDDTTSASDLTTVFRWAQHTMYELSDDQRLAVLSSMSHALPALRAREILHFGIYTMQEESGNLPVAHAVHATTQIDRLLVNSANVLQTEMTMLPVNQFVSRFDDLVMAGCRGLNPPTFPVVAAIVAVVELAFRSNHECKHALLQRCRSEIPPSLQPLLEQVVEMPT